MSAAEDGVVILNPRGFPQRAGAAGGKVFAAKGAVSGFPLSAASHQGATIFAPGM